MPFSGELVRNRRMKFELASTITCSIAIAFTLKFTNEISNRLLKIEVKTWMAQRILKIHL